MASNFYRAQDAPQYILGHSLELAFVVELVVGLLVVTVVVVAACVVDVVELAFVVAVVVGIFVVEVVEVELAFVVEVDDNDDAVCPDTRKAYVSKIKK